MDIFGDSGGILDDGFWNEPDPSRDAPNSDQDFIDWLRSKHLEGTGVVYNGNMYGGTAEKTSDATPVSLENAANSGATSDDTTSETTLDVEESDSTDKVQDKSSDSTSDYEWVTHLNDEDDKTKTETKTETEETSKYPNGMTQEEFNAMYEYALGMSGKGENTSNGIWGSFETLPLKVSELTKALEKYEKSGNETKTNAAREQLESAKEQLNALESFISNYKDIYSPIKEKTKSDYKEEMDYAGEAALKSHADLYAATDQIETIQNGFDYESNKFTPGQKEYTDEYGNEYTTDISVSGDKVTIVTSVYSNDEQFGKSIIQTTNDYKGLEAALSKATENEKNVENKTNYLVSKYNEAKAAYEGATEVTKQDIMDAYAAGKLNAYQAAVALTKSDDHTISFKYDDIISNVDYNKFSGLAGSRGDGTVGVDSFMSDITGPDITAGEKEASPTSISKEITAEFTSLNDLKERLNDIDVSDIKSKEQAEGLSTDLNDFLNDFSVEANNELQTLVTSLLETGGSLQTIKEDPNFKNLSTEIFTLAQSIYDKTCAVEEYTGRYFGDVDISSTKEIKKNIREISDKIAEMQGAKRIVHTDSKGNMSIVLTNEEVKALAKYEKTVESTKDAAIALMKSAAFNGAVNVTGDKYSEAWKKETAVQTVDNNTKTMTKEQFLDKNTLKWTDYLAAGAKGTLGTVVALLGGAVTAINPALGIILMGAGSSAVGKSGLDISTKVARSKSTNEEVMFGTNESGAVNVMNDIYNRSLEPANFGDAKSVGTYTNGMAGALEVIAGFMGFVENPVSAVIAIKDGIENIKSAGSGGLSENTDNVIRNVYELGENIITWSNMDINIDDYMRKPTAQLIASSHPGGSYKSGYQPTSSSYGSASSDATSVLDNKYSGYVEDAKNANLAKDYNAGMEQETNEAVSDKYVKVFKVMLDKEPDYIRKVLIAIPKNHCEREW